MTRLLLTAAVLICSLTARADEGPAPTGLMCNLLAHPETAVITRPGPRFSWIVNSNAIDDLQTAYQLRIAHAEADLADPAKLVWDSGKVASDASVGVPMGPGAEIESQKEYAWQVRTWDKSGVASAWSKPQTFKTGQLRPRVPKTGGVEGRLTVDRYPLEQTPVPPVEVRKLAEGHYFLDFGRDAYAGLKLTIDGGAGGEKVLVHLGEAVTAAGQINRKPGGSIRYLQSELTLKAGKNQYLVTLGPKDGRNMPPEIGPVMPFRYVEVENCPSPIDRGSAIQLATHYPFDDNAARFSSSDKALNDVWELCRYSMKATSFCGLYVDGDRERLPYEADAYINQLGHYCTDREYTLARHSHEHLVLHPTWPTEWIMHSVLIAWADYLYTGDAESISCFYDDLKAKTLYQIERPDGLIVTTKPGPPKDVLAAIHRGEAKDKIRDIVDWPMAERDGYEMKDVNTVVNAFHCRSLLLMSKIAEAVRPADAGQFRALAEKAKRSFNEKLFSAETGLYVDGEGSKHSSLHANVFALAFDLVPPERVEKVTAFVKSRGMACSVYAAQFLMEALYASGQGDYARSLITAKNDRSWAHMAYDVGTTITLEAWDNKYKPNQDWNHAWGAAPANVIPRLLMGIEPVEPGFKKARIRPQLGGLTKASIDLPTIRGTIRLQCESATDRFVAELTIPANMTAEVHVPSLNVTGGVVLVDGKERAGKAGGAFIVLDPIGSGTHHIERRITR